VIAIGADEYVFAGHWFDCHIEAGGRVTSMLDYLQLEEGKYVDGPVDGWAQAKWRSDHTRVVICGWEPERSGIQRVKLYRYRS